MHHDVSKCVILLEDLILHEVEALNRSSCKTYHVALESPEAFKKASYRMALEALRTSSLSLCNRIWVTNSASFEMNGNGPVRPHEPPERIDLGGPFTGDGRLSVP